MSAECMGWVYRFSPAKNAALLVHLALADAANDLHGYEIWMNQTTLADKCRVTRQTVNTALAWLVDEDLIEVLEEGGGRRRPNRYRFLMPLALPVWGPPARPESVKNPDSNPPETVKYATVTVGYPDTLGPETVGNPDTEPKEIYNPSRTQNENNAREPFDAFWDTYPRKAGKGQARKAWTTAITKADPAVIIAAADGYRNDPNRTDQFTPHPATWLNGERWEDDPLPCPNSNTTRAPDRIDTDRQAPAGVLDL